MKENDINKICPHPIPAKILVTKLGRGILAASNKIEKRHLALYVRHSAKRGFILLFAILIGGLLAGIGIAITNLALRQLSITSAGRESQLAFYAADSGAECALYWDIHGADINHLSSPFNFAFPPPDSRSSVAGTMNCGSSIPPPPSPPPAGCSIQNNQVTVCGNQSDSIGNYTSNTFEVDYSASCALVSVKKYDVTNSETRIESSGINDCSATNNPYRTERSIRVEYK